MKDISQSEWVRLSEAIFGQLLERHGFLWQKQPPPGYSVGESNKEYLACSWACAARHSMYVMVLLDRIDHDRIEVDIVWGADWHERIRTTTLYYYYHKTFVEEVKVCLSKSDYPECEVAQRFDGYTRQLLVHRKILEECGEELLAGYYNRFTGYEQKAVNEMEARVRSLGISWNDLLLYWNKLRWP